MSMHEFIRRFWLDITAIISSAVVLGVGGYLSLNGSPVWLNRTGSVIICIGVLVAACRFHDREQARLSERASANEDALYESVKLKLEAQLGKPIVLGQDRDFRKLVADAFQKEIQSLVDIEKQRIKLIEIFLVVGGTLLSGFGDYAFCIFKTCQ